MFNMPGQSYQGPFDALSELETEMRDNIRRHVNVLAGEIGERNFSNYEALIKAKNYIRKTFESYGYTINDHNYKLKDKLYCNIAVEIKGCLKPDEIVIVGAHYDSVIGAIGANDNATGVAAILEMARQYKDSHPTRTLRFIAFTNEEPPLFQTRRMGSYQYAKQAKSKNEKIVAMYSLETIGYYSEEPKSQHYPFPFMFIYPNKANFIAFVSDFKSRKLLYKSIESFRAKTKFPSEGAALPKWIAGVDWSDQWSFWKFGYNAIMITDTALYRYPYYHTMEDTVDKIDFPRLARTVAGLTAMLRD